jgi:hypothetical protein
MSCRDEFVTEENGIAGDRILFEMRLARIAAVWQYRRAVKYHEWATEYNRRVDELNKQLELERKFDEKYAAPWAKELESLHADMDTLLEKWKAGEDVTPADWDAITVGKERKAIHIVHQNLPKEKWPLPVRDKFPNLIALLVYGWEVLKQEYHQKRYAAADEDIAHGSIVEPKSLDYKKRYRELVKHFAKQGSGTMELKQLAGDAFGEIGWQTPMTAEQIEQLHEQLTADQARFERDVDEMLLDRLQYEDVMSQDFDAHAWVRKTFEERNLSTADQAVQRAAQTVRDWVTYWQIHPEGDADILIAHCAASDSPQTRSCYTPYDRPHLEDGREPDFDVDITETCDIDYDDELCMPVEPDFNRIGKALDNNINYEDELFLPNEPVLDQFGMDLDDNTDDDGKFFLPFDT